MKYYYLVRTVMLIHFIMYFLTLGAQSVNSKSFQTSDGNVQITGILRGLKEDETVKFYKLNLDDGKTMLLDSVKVKNGRFILQYQINDAPEIFQISFSRHSSFLVLPLRNEKITIVSNISLDSIHLAGENLVDYVSVAGSKIFTDYIYIELGIGRVWYYTNGGIMSTINKIKDSSLTKEKLEYISGLLRAKQSLDNSVGGSLDYQPIRDVIPIFFSGLNSDFKHSSIWPYIYDLLPIDAKSSPHGKLMSSFMPLCVGQKAPDFNFISNDGFSTSLSNVVKKNKLTILHFWSNNSQEREQIHTQLLHAYQKYKSKSMEIISVSLDANPVKWKRIIEQDKIPGYQTCDFKEEEGPIAMLYKMDAKGTYNILIDQNGKIVAWNVDGPALFGYLFNIYGE